MSEFKKVFYLSLFFIFGTVCLVLFLQKNIKVLEINSTPSVYYAKYGIAPSILTKEKLNKKYKYVYTYIGNIDHREYLKKYPDDAVELRYLGDGEHKIIIFSDKQPDLNFFGR